MDKSDLLHFAQRLHLKPDHASDLFDRLDNDNDGYLSPDDWDRIAAMISYESLVRAEDHPIYCG